MTGRRIWMSCVVMLAVLAVPSTIVAPLPGIGAAAIAAPAPPPVAEPDMIPLYGAPNTRTFASYRTQDGRHIRPLVIRSGSLSGLTPRGIHTLTTRNLRSVIDLRSPVEQLTDRNRYIPGSVTRRYDVFAAMSPIDLVDLPAMYRAFVTNPGARHAFANTFREIIRVTSRGGAALMHCSMGKDRTGWAAAVLLTILGVGRRTVDADFMATNTILHSGEGDMFKHVDQFWLDDALALADRLFGNFDRYVRHGLGLTDAETAALRRALLI